MAHSFYTTAVEKDIEIDQYFVSSLSKDQDIIPFSKDCNEIIGTSHQDDFH